MKRILLAEDEASIREFIVINLVRSGYDVVEAVDGLDALQKFNEYNGDFCIAVLDVMMPNMDGIELCKKLRSLSNKLGIIMLTAKSQEMDKVTGLLVGADDYVTKPFLPSELMARIDSLYRRVSINTDGAEATANKNEIVLGDFTLNLKNRTLTKNGKYIDITQVEFQILEYFFKSPSEALTRSEILDRVWGSSYYGEEKVVDVNIRRLRMKVEDDPSDPQHLITIWGLGYKWIV